MRRRIPPIPHREFFRAVKTGETIACLCTCGRGVDHWYAEPLHRSDESGDRADDPGDVAAAS